MLVKLRRDMFIDGTLYAAKPGPTPMPSEYRNRLPADAEIVIAMPPVEKKGPDTLRDFDDLRAADSALARKLGK